MCLLFIVMCARDMLLIKATYLLTYLLTYLSVTEVSTGEKASNRLYSYQRVDNDNDKFDYEEVLSQEDIAARRRQHMTPVRRYTRCQNNSFCNYRPS